MKFPKWRNMKINLKFLKTDATDGSDIQLGKRVCGKHPWKSNIRKKGRGKTLTKILKAARQKHSS